jgi:short-subunit dehydrogenase
MSLPDPDPGSAVLVTGASSGIGEELARQLGAIGHDLVLVARREERLEALAGELAERHGIHARALAADLSDGAERRRVVSVVREAGDVVTGLCNNAGFGSYGRVTELDPAREAEMVQLNAAAVHELTLAFLGPMVQRGAGAILNVASIAAFQPVPNMATYAATKAFVQSFSEALHAELAGSGVSCTVLCPGPVPTEFGDVAGVDGDADRVPPFIEGDAEDVAAAAIRGMVRGRRSVVPGTATKALATGGRYVPRSILLAAARRATGGGEGR